MRLGSYEMESYNLVVGLKSLYRTGLGICRMVLGTAAGLRHDGWIEP